jgi:hypothetical protein
MQRRLAVGDSKRRKRMIRPVFSSMMGDCFQMRVCAHRRRLSRSGQSVAVAVWDSVENIPAYAAEVALLDRLAGTRAADARVSTDQEIQRQAEREMAASVGPTAWSPSISQRTSSSALPPDPREW